MVNYVEDSRVVLDMEYLGIQERHMGWIKIFGSHQLIFGGTGIREIPWHITWHKKRSWPGMAPRRGRWQRITSQRRGVKSDQKGTDIKRV